MKFKKYNIAYFVYHKIFIKLLKLNSKKKSYYSLNQNGRRISINNRNRRHKKKAYFKRP